jgi:photosystem II stability/assembly factor-like uncharacterized protein
MKTIIIIFFLLSIQLMAQNSGQYTYIPQCNLWQIEAGRDQTTQTYSDVFNWSFVQTPVTSQLTDIIFTNLMNGWATHTGTGAIGTNDGGTSWDVVSFHDSTFTTSYNGVYFINEHTGWCVGGAVQIRKTTNGGVNWIKQYSPPAAGVLNGVYFWNESIGLAIGRKTINFNSFIARTTNGGSTWTEIIATTNSNNELQDQYWFDSNTGWISGRDVLLRTTNGGINYVNLYANVPPTQNGANALLSITFVNQQTGWIGGSNLDKKNIYKTTNGGTNWFFQPNPVANYVYTQINDVKFITQDSGWAIHGTPFSGAIMFTTNGGNNWEIEEGSNNWFDCIAVYQRAKAWIGSSGGKVWFANLITGTGGNQNQVPEKFALLQNHPNPFNPSTLIRFEVPLNKGEERELSVQLKIYGILGREVDVLVDELLKPGSYEVIWDASNFPSGIYFYRLETEGFSETKRMILMK